MVGMTLGKGIITGSKAMLGSNLLYIVKFQCKLHNSILHIFGVYIFD